ncbi:MAG: hypothetical protein NE334_16615 [Lentisphaeraceae bacterium]|nr:hypothetical protein [Lentisphaeraceae bacterium]
MRFILVLLFMLLTSDVFSAGKKHYPESAFDQSSIELEKEFSAFGKLKILLIPGKE